MREPLPTRDRLVAAMADLMRFQGYGATSVKQVVDHASAPIGSLYHFFPQGKRQIAADALRSTGAAYIALVPVLLDPHDDLSSGLRAFFDAAVGAGAQVLHEPRVWPEYHPAYYGAFVRDPDGNNVEAVCHQPE